VQLVALQRLLEVGDMVGPEAGFGELAAPPGLFLVGGSVVFAFGVRPDPVVLDAELGVGLGQPVLPQLQLLDHQPVELLAVLLLPPLQHLPVLLQLPLHLQELLSELGVEPAQLSLPRPQQVGDQVWRLDGHADHPWLHIEYKLQFPSDFHHLAYTTHPALFVVESKKTLINHQNSLECFNCPAFGLLLFQFMYLNLGVAAMILQASSE
jgi:hypothetical protein